MNRARKITISILVGLLIIVAGVAAVSHQPSKHRQEPKPRIVATTDAVVDIAAKLDLDLVGVPKTTGTLPARYDHVARIGSPMAPNIEKIASLKPTRVYSVSVLKDQYSAAFKAQKFHPVFLKLNTIEELKQTLRQLGNQYGRSDQAAHQIKLIQRAETTAKQRAHGPKPRVLILMGMPGAGYMIATEHSYVGDLVKKAGGQNVYAGTRSAYLAPNDESLATKDPAVILRLEHAMPQVVLPQFQREFKANALWGRMDAVKHGRVYDLQQPVFNATATIEAATALKRVSKWLYPD